ncbi:glyoxalase [Actinomadura craniellae]|uniref:Glyoxalase n=1 Tax=Actinomadura craniellae TaxID=2231787 RepID=A0A365H9J5_9ACTN|nr:VOC family protein [Actinomadura craniellae]RAY15689.1 glyoxalase [Actinomadura craniellae]
MKITASAVSLNVEDVEASSGFLVRHFGFQVVMSADGFASLTRDDAGMNVIYLRRGLPTLPADQRDDHAGGLILAFTVDDLEGELARLEGEGVTITMPLTAEEWGERAFQVRDPNGVIVQLVDWNAPADG